MSAEEDHLFNEIAIEKGFITEEQADDCRRAHTQVTEAGLSRSLTRMMLEKNLITQDQAREIRAEMSRRGVHVRLGGYEVISRVGEGGMGTVFRARQASLNRTVALKVLPTSHAKDKTYLERFYREARIAGGLNHPNIVQVYDVGEDNGRHYIAMEFITGKTVAQLLKQEGAIPEERSLEIIADVARGLAYAHESNVIHRDIKPGNILLTDEGMAKLADLGIAKHTASKEASLTQSGVAMGTPSYMAPEQARQAKDVDPRSDIYGLGATLFHMVTGQVPFTGETPYQVILKQATEPLPSPKSLNPDLSDGICALINRMMAKDPKDRSQSADELRAQVAQLRGVPLTDAAHAVTSHGGSSSTRTITPAGPAGPRRWPIYAGAAALLCAILLIIGSAVTSARQRGRREAAAHLVNEGVNYYSEGAYRQALDAFDRALATPSGLSADNRRTVADYVRRAKEQLSKQAPPESTPAVAHKPGHAPPPPKPRPKPEPAAKPKPTPPPEPEPTHVHQPAPAPVDKPFPEAPREPHAKPEPPAPTRDSFKNALGITMVRIPQGDFLTPQGPKWHMPSFHLSAHEVTNAQFLPFVKDMLDPRARTRVLRGGRGTVETYLQELRKTIKEIEHAKPDLPALSISGYHALYFCGWLSEKDGRPYRLPTPAEWEYACRGQTRTRYYWGDQRDREKANFADADGKGKPMKVGSFSPNPWGLYDMLGNAAEWCAARNPQGREPDFFLRGGAYDMPIRLADAPAFRVSGRHRRLSAGFRVLYDPKGPVRRTSGPEAAPGRRPRRP